MSATEMTSFTESEVVIDDRRVRYISAGEGAPLLVLQGTPGLHPNRTLELLAAQSKVFAIEIPATGESTGAAAWSSMSVLAQAVIAVADALGLEGFSLMGSSFGGALAATVAVEHADKIDKLVLISPIAIRTDDFSPSYGATTPEELKASLFAHPEDQDLPDVDLQPIEANASMNALLGPPRDSELEARLGEVSSPTLVLFGTDDQVTPPALGTEYVELMADAYLALVYDAGHGLEIERPEAAAEIIGDFLERGPKFNVSNDSTMIFP